MTALAALKAAYDRLSKKEIEEERAVQAIDEPHRRLAQTKAEKQAAETEKVKTATN